MAPKSAILNIAIRAPVSNFKIFELVIIFKFFQYGCQGASFKFLLTHLKILYFKQGY
jgi:hypothetical protein